MTVCAADVLVAKLPPEPPLGLNVAVNELLPPPMTGVTNVAWPFVRAALEPPGMATPLLKNVTVPVAPLTAPLTCAVSVYVVPALVVVATGVSRVVVVVAGVMSAVAPAGRS